LYKTKPPYEYGVNVHLLKSEEETGTDRDCEGIPEDVPSFSAYVQQPAQTGGAFGVTFCGKGDKLIYF